MNRLGMIGAGGMAATIMSALAQHLSTPLEKLTVMTRSGGLDETQALAAPAVRRRVARDVSFSHSLEALLEDEPDIVVECAGHAAVRDLGPRVLESGVDLLIASTGALADAHVETALDSAARRGGARLLISGGAIGGLDVLSAARLSGLLSVEYIGRKPPAAWRGTAAEKSLDLSNIREETTFFRGTAREAAGAYPQNANVAAVVALAGLGFDATRVRLVADPGAARNIHVLEVKSHCVAFTIQLEGVPSPDNPRTSLTAGYSLAHTLLLRRGEVVL